MLTCVADALPAPASCPLPPQEEDQEYDRQEEDLGAEEDEQPRRVALASQPRPRRQYAVLLQVRRSSLLLACPLCAAICARLRVCAAVASCAARRCQASPGVARGWVTALAAAPEPLLCWLAGCAGRERERHHELRW